MEDAPLWRVLWALRFGLPRLMPLALLVGGSALAENAGAPAALPTMPALIEVDEGGGEALHHTPLVREPLAWTRHPGAFEQELRRRIGNPLFAPERQVVRSADLERAKIRDATDARVVLTEFVDLALDRNKMARAESIDEIELSLERYRTTLQRILGVGGEAAPLADSLRTSRGQLIEAWRERHAESPELLAALDDLTRPWALDSRASLEPFTAQLAREDGPIARDELVPSLLSESDATIERVLASLKPRERRAVRRDGLALLRELQGVGVEIEGEQEKIAVLKSGT